MKKALIIFNNKSSKTRRFGEEIAAFLLNRGLATELITINNFEPTKLQGADYLLLSGWKSKSLISFSQPDSEWNNFVNKLPSLNGMRIAMFATYNFFAGGIFRRMKKYLSGKTKDLGVAIKSNDGSLSISDKMTLNEFID